jgi:outer membrane protein TolC
VLDACLAHRLDLQALRRGYVAGQERVRQAVLEQFPDIVVGVHYQRNETALQFIGGFVSFELPLFNRNQGSVAIGRATRQRLRFEYDARVASTRADLRRLRRLSALLRRQLPEVKASIPGLTNIEQQERAAVARGDLDRLSYQTVRTALFNQRLEQANLSQALAEAEVGLQTACGGPLGSRSAP